MNQTKGQILPNMEDFRKAIVDPINEASSSGKYYIDINSGELHRILGGYPQKGHSMPS